MFRKMITSAKEFFGGLGRHWVWTLLFLMFLAPLLVTLLAPVTAKIKAFLPKKAA